MTETPTKQPNINTIQIEGWVVKTDNDNFTDDEVREFNLDFVEWVVSKGLRVYSAIQGKWM